MLCVGGWVSINKYLIPQWIILAVSCGNALKQLKSGLVRFVLQSPSIAPMVISVQRQARRQCKHLVVGSSKRGSNSPWTKSKTVADLNSVTGSLLRAGHHCWSSAHGDWITVEEEQMINVSSPRDNWRPSWDISPCRIHFTCHVSLIEGGGSTDQCAVQASFRHWWKGGRLVVCRKPTYTLICT